MIDITKADLDKVEKLPDTRLHTPKDVKFMGGLPFVPLFCANCGKPGPYVLEENCDFACYLCEPCAVKLEKVLDGAYIEPNVHFWERVRREQIDKYGRVLEEQEIAEQLSDPDSFMSKLQREGRKSLRTGR